MHNIHVPGTHIIIRKLKMNNASLKTRNLTKETVRELLVWAVHEHADGHPTQLAKLIPYDYSNMRAVIRGGKTGKKLPLPATMALCKLIGLKDAAEICRSQYME